MTMTLHGKIRGKTIELDEDPGVSDGMEVEVQMRFVTRTPGSPPPMSEGLAKL